MSGFEEDVTDGQGELIAGVELDAAQGLSDMDPVSSAIAGAAGRSRSQKVLTVTLFDGNGVNSLALVRTC